MSSQINSRVFQYCVVCDDKKDECNCQPCSKCGIIEFCICEDLKMIIGLECSCENHTNQDNLTCDCPCSKCIGQRLDFKERINSGEIPLPYCLCDWSHLSGNFQCTCTCLKCSGNFCEYIYKCPNCGTKADIDDNDGFCSRYCAVEYMDMYY